MKKYPYPENMTAEHFDKIKRAKKFCSDAHRSIDQKRKYSGEPYEVHPNEVAAYVAEAGCSVDAICAAYLHDVVEDVNVYPYNPRGITEHFGAEVNYLVWELTDVFTKENYPSLNRAKRKALEADRLSYISPESKSIKLADLICNTKDIVEQDKGFAVTYLKEKAVILPGLKGGNAALFADAQRLLKSGQRQLNIS